MSGSLVEPTTPTPELEQGTPSNDDPVTDPPMAFVGDVAVPWDAFETIMQLKVEKYTSRGRVLPTSALLRYRRSTAMRVARFEQLRQATEALGRDYDPTKLSIQMSRQRQQVDDWPAFLRRRGETEGSVEAMRIAELREELLLANLSMPPETPADRAAVFKRLEALNPPRLERFLVSRVFVPDSEDLERAEQLATRAATTPMELGDMAEEEHGEVGWSNTLTRSDFLRPEVREAVKELPIGRVSAPIPVGGGWEVIVVHTRWAPGVGFTADEVAVEIDTRMPRYRLRQYLDRTYPVRWFVNVSDAETPARPTQPTKSVERLPEPQRF